MREYQKDFITLYDDFQDGENRKRKAEKINYILEKLRLHNPQGTCLDTGCSNGIITRSMAKLFASVVGVDIDMTAMKLINPRENPAVSYVYGDAMGLPFADESFEALVCSQTYEHVPSSPHLFAEMLRVMKPGGVVFFSGPNKTFPIEPHYYLPFLHWLPEKWADRYLRLTKRGTHYYERSRTYWDLRRTFLKDYEVHDAMRYVLQYYALVHPKSGMRRLYGLAAKLPPFLLKLLSPFMVNINWVLVKRGAGKNGSKNIQFAL
ncbi:MAG TPA: methyltransferase domain-containing protein [Anaerolineaceae bacterium]|jgi:2-polyprenyl-3-methyl-5-hydroxy-6-metoxy-1,4-benzoquinol methylase|nr:methyltransferase domain-containing protein [Anaerolineaceae bacterium]HOE34308.1 methyltransferase domain-containing protein [Anaerolineaceae bacterium]HOT25589.1 methyltransferase domain-containing protein [Anaerolineaceae bacterium]HQH57223.1 methyltransferase domain-containing protein [Anaerolineaceae bacterium]HQK03010.1 methyltransferase domain-containing protein [Anaerolineaceae bacterium]